MWTVQKKEEKEDSRLNLASAQLVCLMCLRLNHRSWKVSLWFFFQEVAVNWEKNQQEEPKVGQAMGVRSFSRALPTAALTWQALRDPDTLRIVTRKDLSEFLLIPCNKIHVISLHITFFPVFQAFVPQDVQLKWIKTYMMLKYCWACV